MKILIINSIQIYGIGDPNTKTVFNIKSELDRNHIKFKNLEVLQNRKLTVWFNYEENGTVFKENSLKLTIPVGTELEIKEYIITQINQNLTN